MFRIAPNEINTYAVSAKKLIDKLSENEVAYLIALKTGSECSPLENPSKEFKTILRQFESDLKIKKEENTTTFTDLLWDALVNKSYTTHLPPNELQLKNLPEDVTCHMLQFMNASSMINSSRTDKSKYSLFSRLSTINDPLMNGLSEFKRALENAAVGKWDDVFIALDADPDLLLITGTTEFCGRYKYSGMTIYQIGLKNYENGRAYHDKMLKLFERCTNGIQEMSKQYLEVFPDGKLLCSTWDADKAIGLFCRLVNAVKKYWGPSCFDPNIANPHESDIEKNLRAAYKHFWNYVNPEKMTLPLQGLVSDPDFFISLLDEYTAEDSFLSAGQKLFLEKFVLDAYMLQLPTGVLRAFCQGLEGTAYTPGGPTNNGCTIKTIDVLPRAGSKFDPKVHYIKAEEGTIFQYHPQGGPHGYHKNLLEIYKAYIRRKQREIDVVSKELLNHHQRTNERDDDTQQQDRGCSIQ